MNKKRTRTAVVVAVLLAGLLVGASFALAQDGDESVSADDVDATFQEMAEGLEAEVAPLMGEIKEMALDTIDDAVASGYVTEEQAEAFRQRVDGFRLPQGFPFHHKHDLPLLDLEGFDPQCFGFGPDSDERPEDCPEFPSEFPFGDFRFGFGPMSGDMDEKWEHLGEELESFVDGLDFDFEQLEELLESGSSLDEALTEMDVDVESLLAGARDDVIAKVDELVADGTISEDKADMIKEMLEGIDFSAGFPFDLEDFDFDGFGSHEHFGGHHGDEDSGDS